MPELEGWYIHVASSEPDKRGPYPTETLEDFATQGILVSDSRISHARYTKGKIVEAKRIARFFNIFARVTDETSLSLNVEEHPIAAFNIGGTERRDEVHGIGRFMADGQDPAMICKLAERVDGICTREENALYMAVQQRPVVNFSPDAVVLTNRRAIVFRQKILGRLQFVDVPWLNVADVHLDEDVMGATISIRGQNGHVEQVSFLPKTQARKIYRIAQEMEERMVELRRERAIEEKRAGATNVTVNNDLGSIVKPTGTSGQSSDPVAALKSLRAMLDAGLIDETEFEFKKRQIMDRL